jgi:hypothetical protein
VEVAKETGVRWKALSEEEKQPFLDQAMADKQRYDEEVSGRCCVLNDALCAESRAWLM